jgi:lipopolysaccharide transport system ATP-binding protein
MGDLAIRVQGLGKQYRIGRLREPYKSLRDVISRAAFGPFRAVRSRLSRGERRGTAGDSAFWALRDVSFEVKQGEVLGVIGRNGAGKSTLLKILSRITDPTEGSAELRGRIGSLLEVGTGFHPELTGRENVYLSGSILGMKKTEIDRKFDEIVAFAEVERFIDTMVKRYSSGMYLRLAFAVAAHLDPEILLVDEVLAVGDAGFQNKCLGRMGTVAQAGRTVLFVSHNMGTITRLCPRALWLDEGRLRQDGPAAEVVHSYQAQIRTTGGSWTRAAKNLQDRDFAFTDIGTLDGNRRPAELFAADERIVVRICYSVNQKLSACAISVRVYNSEGSVVFTTSDGDSKQVSALGKSPGSYVASFSIPPRFLAPGSYTLQVAAHAPMRHMYELLEACVSFEVSPSGSLGSLDGRLGMVQPLLEWATEPDDAAGRPHAGAPEAF